MAHDAQLQTDDAARLELLGRVNEAIATLEGRDSLDAADRDKLRVLREDRAKLDGTWEPPPGHKFMAEDVRIGRGLTM